MGKCINKKKNNALLQAASEDEDEESNKCRDQTTPTSCTDLEKPNGSKKCDWLADKSKCINKKKNNALLQAAFEDEDEESNKCRDQTTPTSCTDLERPNGSKKCDWLAD